MRYVNADTTSLSINVFIQDSSSTTGAGLTGLAYDTGSLVASYVRAGASRSAITLATLAAANSAWSSGGFKEIDSTNMPGWYRFDVPDAVLAAGATEAGVTIHGAANMAPLSIGFMLQQPKVDVTKVLGNDAKVYVDVVQSGTVEASPSPTTSSIDVNIGTDRATGFFDQAWIGIVSGDGAVQWRVCTTHTRVSATVARFAFSGAATDPDGPLAVAPDAADDVKITGRGPA